MARGTSRKALKHVGGAVALALASRLLGLLREATGVAAVGVHNYTDAYFAVSSIVLWLQNWAFGAFGLYAVPKMLSLDDAALVSWYRRARRAFFVAGVALALAFVAGFGPLERWMLGGRNALEIGPVVMLAACIPLTLVAGVSYARANVETRGIVGSAAGIFTANLMGTATLIAIVALPVDRSWALPLCLFATQGGLALLLTRVAAGLERTTERVAIGAPISRSQAFAAGAENAVFNVNVIVQQAIAGRMAAGAVTLNAYAIRLLVNPLLGVLQPLQQRLLIGFALDSPRAAARTARRMVTAALSAGVGVGVIAAAAVRIALPVLPSGWQAWLWEYEYWWILLAYGLYAGIMFGNQTLARAFFARNAGWTYAVVMATSYTAGSALRVVTSGALGLFSIPACGLVAEGVALAFMVVRQRAASETTMSSAVGVVDEGA